MPQDGVDALYAPRRTVIDPILVDRAREVGADVRHGVALTAIERTAAGRVTGVVIADRSGAIHATGAGLVIGADGRRSTMAGLVGAAIYRSGRHSTAAVYAYAPGLPNDGFNWCYPGRRQRRCHPDQQRRALPVRLDPSDGFRTRVQP